MNYLFCVGTAFSRSTDIFQALIILYNILFGCYWKIKNELISCIANFIPVIISLILILIMARSSDVGTYFTKIFVQILFISVIIIIIFFVIPENLVLQIIGISTVITSISKILIPADNLNSFLKKKDYQSHYDLKLLFFGFICYGGWLLFGLIIGDLYCIISNGIISLIWMISLYFNCWFKFNKKKKDKEDKKNNNKDIQIKSRETELEEKE